ncbi:MAG: hypothetical protein LBF85_00300, partial [Tannerella sp.]|nr:hypothetical protein [Tannerella sp.]
IGYTGGGLFLPCEQSIVAHVCYRNCHSEIFMASKVEIKFQTDMCMGESFFGYILRGMIFLGNLGDLGGGNLGILCAA